MKKYSISSPINNTKLKKLAKIFEKENIAVSQEYLYDSAISIISFVCSKELQNSREKETH